MEKVYNLGPRFYLLDGLQEIILERLCQVTKSNEY